MLFSIITVCRNNIQELILTNESVFSQSFIDFEWIVIDGNSTDGTRDWLMENIPNTDWISEPDRGIYDAMNKGISRSKGEYLIFMNSGDRFNDNRTLAECQTSIVQNEYPAFVYGDSIDVAEDGKYYYRKAKPHSKNWKGMITQHQAMFFNRNALGDISYQEKYKLSGDYALISKFIKQLDDNEIFYFEYPICKFSMGGVNESKRFDALKEDYNIRKEIINLPFYLNMPLYSLHLIHTLFKKTYPSTRFLKHKAAC